MFQDSVSIRAITFLDEKTLAFAGSNGTYGSLDVVTDKVRVSTIRYDEQIPEFRAVGHTTTDFFMLSVGSPALLYKTGDGGQMELVYIEEGSHVFYDSMAFWNDQEGIAIGDGVDGCLAVIITRDGGKHWKKLSCDEVPKLSGDVGAYAASDTNVEIKGNKTWVITSGKAMLFSPDKGKSWELIQLPIKKLTEYHGIYSIDFYDQNLGFGIGGDFDEPEGNNQNKIITQNGGKDWKIVANNAFPGYKSCIQYVPNSNGMGLVAVGFTGVDYSKDGGKTWVQLSEESFYTLRFLNDSVAYAAGRNRIARITFK